MRAELSIGTVSLLRILRQHYSPLPLTDEQPFPVLPNEHNLYACI